MVQGYQAPMHCSLCESKLESPYFVDQKKSWTYWHCDCCDIVFRDPQSFLNHLQEKARYQTHNNSIEQPGYVNFLQPAVEAVSKYVAPGSEGLDFGCGPGPTLSELLRRQGFDCLDYDPFFCPQPELLDETYDFVTCTEVVEHFYNPAKEFNKIDKILKTGGNLVVMTDNSRDEKEFANWGYRHDPTHVCFFNPQSWQFVAEKWNWELVECGPRVSVFKKSR